MASSEISQSQSSGTFHAKATLAASVTHMLRAACVGRQVVRCCGRKECQAARGHSPIGTHIAKRERESNVATHNSIPVKRYKDPGNPYPQIWGVKISPPKFRECALENTVKQVFFGDSPPISTRGWVFRGHDDNMTKPPPFTGGKPSVFGDFSTLFDTPGQKAWEDLWETY